MTVGQTRENAVIWKRPLPMGASLVDVLMRFVSKVNFTWRSNVAYLSKTAIYSWFYVVNGRWYSESRSKSLYLSAHSSAPRQFGRQLQTSRKQTKRSIVGNFGRLEEYSSEFDAIEFITRSHWHQFRSPLSRVYAAVHEQNRTHKQNIANSLPSHHSLH